MRRTAVTLMIASVLSLILMVVHISQDIVLGFAPGGLGNITVLVVGLIYLYGALVLTDRRSGRIIMLLGGFIAVGVSIIHMTKSGLQGPHSKPGGVPFVFVDLAIGVNGLFCFALAARELWMTRSRKTE